MLKTKIFFVLCALIYVFPGTLTAEFSLEDVYQKFKKKPYVVTRFSQTVFTSAINRTSHATGDLTYYFPGQSRWDYTTPEAQSIIIDPKKIIIVDPVLETVSIRKLAGAVSDSALVFLTGNTAAIKSFKKLDQPKKRVLNCQHTPIFYALPKDDIIQEIHICYNQTLSFFDSVYILETNGNYRTFFFKNTQFKTPDINQFNYDVPDEWEIIRE